MKSTSCEDDLYQRLPPQIQKKRIHRVIQEELTPAQREVLIAYYFQDMNMTQIAAQRGVPVSHVAINWSTQKDFVDTAIMGCSKPNHAIQNCAALDWSLSGEEIRILDQAIAQNLE